MRRSRTGSVPPTLPIHRWADGREPVEDANAGDVDWVRELLHRRERRERDRADRSEGELPVELRRFLRRDTT